MEPSFSGTQPFEAPWEARQSHAARPSPLEQLDALIAQGKKLSDTSRVTLIGELQDLQKRARYCFEALGSSGQDALREICKLNFETPGDEGYKTLSGLLGQLERARKEIESLGTSAEVAPAVTHTLRKSEAASSKRKRRSARARRLRARRSTNLTPTQRRAQTVAHVLEELNRLRPRMTGTESDYSKLAKEYPHFLTFKVARRHPDLKEKILAIQGHRRHYRLAQEIVAAHFGKSFETIRTDWKKHKPAKFRYPK